MTPEEVAAEVLAELTRARAKFPAFHSGHEGFAVIKEELDELWEDVKADRSARAEAIQVAAMAIRFVLDLHEAGL